MYRTDCSDIAYYYAGLSAKYQKGNYFIIITQTDKLEPVVQEMKYRYSKYKKDYNDNIGMKWKKQVSDFVLHKHRKSSGNINNC